LARAENPFALAAVLDDSIFLARDPFGVRPLYYGRTANGILAFASEVKALLHVTRQIHEFPIAHWYDRRSGFQNYIRYNGQPMHDWPSNLPSIDDRPPGIHAQDLCLRLEQAVCRRLTGDEMGIWLSGGVNSSAIAALARPHLTKLHAVVVGLEDAPDLEYARRVADHLQCEFHPVLFTFDDALRVLSDVIYSLESFDPLLVRRGIVSYLAAKESSNFVSAIFTGDGGDELFAGHSASTAGNPEQRQNTLLDSLNKMHLTALQRVDRAASAFSIVPYIPFLDLEVSTFVWRIVKSLGRAYEGKHIEKWILSKAIEDMLPQDVLQRRKVYMAQGAGLSKQFANQAEKEVSDHDFNNMRALPNGWTLATKEEAWFYRIFKERFGAFNDLNWMGRAELA
jgi:asparagine synthase (glutamine-hydrolysing)